MLKDTLLRSSFHQVEGSSWPWYRTIIICAVVILILFFHCWFCVFVTYFFFLSTRGLSKMWRASVHLLLSFQKTFSVNTRLVFTKFWQQSKGYSCKMKQCKVRLLHLHSSHVTPTLLTISNADRLSSIPRYKRFFLLGVRSPRSPEVAEREQNFLRADNLSLALVLIAADVRLLSWLSIFIL